jgi:hypothetical protein
MKQFPIAGNSACARLQVAEHFGGWPILVATPIVRYLLVIFLIFALGAASCPFALSGLWTRRWFRICWYLTMFILVSGFIRSR